MLFTSPQKNRPTVTTSYAQRTGAVVFYSVVNLNLETVAQNV